MSNLDDLVKICDKFSDTQEKQNLNDISLVSILNKNKKNKEQKDIAVNIATRLRQDIKNEKNLGELGLLKYKRLDDALDYFISAQNKRSIQTQDVYNHISEKLNSNLFQVDTYFKEYQYYISIRRAYSETDCVAVSIVKLTYDEKNTVTTYQIFRYSDTFDAYYVSKGGVFTNGSSTLVMSGITEYEDIQNPYAPKIMEHMYLNISPSNFEAKNIFDGLYLGCCVKNHSCTPFCTRVCFLPIKNSLITKENVKLLENFSFSFPLNDTSSDFEKLEQYVRETHKNIQSHDVGFNILKTSMDSLQVTLQDVCERIICKIDDRDSFGGLREFSFFG